MWISQVYLRKIIITNQNYNWIITIYLEAVLGSLDSLLIWF